MTAISVDIEDYATSSSAPAIVVEQWEGLVHLDCRQLDYINYPSLKPEEAEALAAVLLYQAEAARA